MGSVVPHSCRLLSAQEPTPRFLRFLSGLWCEQILLSKKTGVRSLFQQLSECLGHPRMGRYPSPDGGLHI